jgi:hypothetical protein
MQWGLPLHNLKVAAVPLVLSGCVVAKENPHALLLQAFCRISMGKVLSVI